MFCVTVLTNHPKHLINTNLRRHKADVCYCLEQQKPWIVKTQTVALPTLVKQVQRHDKTADVYGQQGERAGAARV